MPRPRASSRATSPTRRIAARLLGALDEAELRALLAAVERMVAADVDAGEGA